MKQQVYQTVINGKREPVFGTPISIFSALDTFAYKNKLWYIVEVSTGLSLGFANTKKDAIERVRQVVNEVGLDTTLDLIDYYRGEVL